MIKSGLLLTRGLQFTAVARVLTTYSGVWLTLISISPSSFGMSIFIVLQLWIEEGELAGVKKGRAVLLGTRVE